jgi:hypothetical protein
MGCATLAGIWLACENTKVEYISALFESSSRHNSCQCQLDAKNKRKLFSLTSSTQKTTEIQLSSVSKKHNRQSRLSLITSRWNSA